MRRFMEMFVSRTSIRKRCFLRGAIVFIVAPMLLSGCAYVVKKTDYEKDTKETQAKVDFLRRQLIAHTQILQNQGRSINEVQLQLRDVTSLAKKSNDAIQTIAKPKKKMAAPTGRKKSSSKKGAMKSGANIMGGNQIGKSLFIRSSYRGLPLNYAGGYRAPRGKRFPYRLPPGTLVKVISRDNRGFTRIQVRSGRWKGRKMWVRTRWLVTKMASLGAHAGLVAPGASIFSLILQPGRPVAHRYPPAQLNTG
jgi:hypothetical protein